MLARASPPRLARALQLGFDLVVRARGRRQLLERDVEEPHRLLLVALAAVRGREVGGDQAFVLRLAEVAGDCMRFDEAGDRAVRVSGRAEGEGEVVQRQRLGSPVAELANDLQRVEVELARALRVARAAGVAARGVQAERLLLQPVPVARALGAPRGKAAAGRLRLR